ncbi:MAG: ComEC/Rec2 family competence protein, partial [Burkholderiales bacterium]
QSAPIRRFLSAREESWFARTGRNLAMIFLTGLVIEFALMPIGLYHFHKAGFYGAFANVIAIPLTTLVVMPLIAGSLALDLAGLGAPGWWLVDQALKGLLGLAHWVSAQPGAVTRMPEMGRVSFILFAAGGLWLALWRGNVRLLGLIPATIGTISLALLQPPDVLVSRDGRHVGITDPASGDLLILRDGRSTYAKDNLFELSGMNGSTRLLSDWEGARCNGEFCSVTIERDGRTWFLLITRGRDYVPERALAAACERSDIVIADRWLPASCRPRWLKADRAVLSREGGMAIDLNAGRVRSVAQSQGQHGWSPTRDMERNPGNIRPATFRTRPDAQSPQL